MIERKHIEAIKEAWAVVDARVDWDNVPIGQTAAALDDAISTALAAADESPCVWSRIGGDGPWHPSCLGEHPHVSWSMWSRGHMEKCPHCGRKIEELPAAPEVKP